jgi:hypothetical protein
MPGTGDDPRDQWRDDRPLCEVSFGAYCSARERFFARLQADSELRRLEKAWSMPARDPWPPRPAS